jgi:orotate phosphoribosyltransferase
MFPGFYRNLILDLLKTHSLKIAPPGEEFDLASGEKSRFYLDVKKTAFQGKAHFPLAYLLYDVLAHGEFGPVQAVAGVPLGGCHLASIVALYAPLHGKTQLDVVYVRDKAKDHGTKSLVEAPAHDAGFTVVLLEDVITTGGSSMEAAKRLREAGYDVRGVLAVVDRRTAPSPSLPDDLMVRSVFTLDDFADSL